ncbi:MAG: hypothetical protein ACR2GZ_12225 [Solirubrobacteraceae bacterium]
MEENLAELLGAQTIPAGGPHVQDELRAATEGGEARIVRLRLRRSFTDPTYRFRPWSDTDLDQDQVLLWTDAFLSF